jgi:hypothetical protein
MPTIRDNVQTASPVSGGHLVRSTDWGVLPPGATGTAFSAGANLTNVGSGGSLANGNTFFKITWVTANGESLPSVEASVTVTGGPSGSVTVALASVGSTNAGAQALAAPIIGWNIYSSTTTGTELLNKDANSLSVTLSSQVLPNGTVMTFIPIATTSAAVKIVGNGAAPPTHNSTGVQLPLPNIGANNSSDLFLVVGRHFRPQKEVNWIRPSSSADAGGLLVSLMDCVAPLWASGTSMTADTSYIIVNSTVFVCVVSGTSAGSIPAGLTTRPAKGSTVVDNAATWLSLGEAALVRIRFSNTTGSAGQPIAQEYDVFQA